jgi:ribonucleoside-diphosphate reductase alpha chain
MPVNPNKVVIDLGRDARLTQQALDTLHDRYLIPGETSPQHAFARASAAFADDVAHAQRLYEYSSLGWFTFATPLLSNGGTKRGLPISCFLNYMPDSRVGIIDHYAETAMLSSVGGGVGSYVGHVRSAGIATSRGSAGSGAIAMTVPMDKWIFAFSQGKTRRGSYAAYLDILHPEVMEWIGLRKPTGGDANRKALNLHHAVVISDAFMEAFVKAEMIELVDPKKGPTGEWVSAREVFTALCETRHQTGEPYILYGDTANRALPQPLKDKGLRIHHSNLCTEIMLPTNADRTAVCCLSSLNLAMWDEWKDHPLFILDLMRMLDNCLQDFIDNAPPELWRAVNSAKSERSVGLGALGFHTFLQDRLVSWGSGLARGYNAMIFQHIKKKTDEASLLLGAERGEAPDMEGTGERFAHKMAIAPNASSSIFVNVSPSCEQFSENAYLHKTLTGSHPVKNPSLERLLETKGKNTNAIWMQIIEDAGSVRNLDFLSPHEKEVFLTSYETDQTHTIVLAADRTPLIDQGQSVNLFVPAEVEADYFTYLHYLAWELGIKSLYYVRSKTAHKAENTNTKQERVMMASAPEDSTCVACEG